jgi:hypothetical protein
MARGPWANRQQQTLMSGLQPAYMWSHAHSSSAVFLRYFHRASVAAERAAADLQYGGVPCGADSGPALGALRSSPGHHNVLYLVDHVRFARPPTSKRFSFFARIVDVAANHVRLLVSG